MFLVAMNPPLPNVHQEKNIMQQQKPGVENVDVEDYLSVLFEGSPCYWLKNEDEIIFKTNAIADENK